MQALSRDEVTCLRKSAATPAAHMRRDPPLLRNVRKFKAKSPFVATR